MRITSLLVFAVVAFAPAASAQTAPDTENGRYVFNQVADGMLRLDTRTGQVSLCAKKDTGWACGAVPDERQALESEITRLQRENGALKKDIDLTGGVVEGAKPLPADGEIVKVAVGPSNQGTFKQPAQSRKVSTGDIVIIPPGVYHGFTDVADHVEYVSVRPDPDHVLPAGYVHPLLKK